MKHFSVNELDKLGCFDTLIESSGSHVQMKNEKSNLEKNTHLSCAICQWWESWKNNVITDLILSVYLSGAWSASSDEIADDIQILKSIVENSSL